MIRYTTLNTIYEVVQHEGGATVHQAPRPDGAIRHAVPISFEAAFAQPFGFWPNKQLLIQHDDGSNRVTSLIKKVETGLPDPKPEPSPLVAALEAEGFDSERLAVALVLAAENYERRFSAAPDGVAEEAEAAAREIHRLARRIYPEAP